MTSNLLTAGIALVVISIAAPAAALIKFATVTGTVHDGYDYSGEWGPANTDPTGKSFVARLVYDTTLGTRSTGPMHDLLRGGPAFGSISPYLSTTVTLGGVVTEIDSSTYGGRIGTRLNTDVEVYIEDDRRTSTHLYNSLSIYFNGTAPRSLNTNFSAFYSCPYYYLVCSIATVSLYEFDYATSTITREAYAHITDLSLVVEGDLPIGGGGPPVGGTVPEPAAWTLMIGGFGLVGAAARSRRRTVAA